jgi:hypothetical protein
VSAIAAKGQYLHLTHSATCYIPQFKEGSGHILRHLVILEDFHPESNKTACNFKIIATKKIRIAMLACCLPSHPKKHDKQNVNAM